MNEEKIDFSKQLEELHTSVKKNLQFNNEEKRSLQLKKELDFLFYHKDSNNIVQTALEEKEQEIKKAFQMDSKKNIGAQVESKKIIEKTRFEDAIINKIESFLSEDEEITNKTSARKIAAKIEDIEKIIQRMCITGNFEEDMQNLKEYWKILLDDAEKILDTENKGKRLNAMFKEGLRLPSIENLEKIAELFSITMETGPLLERVLSYFNQVTDNIVDFTLGDIEVQEAFETKRLEKNNNTQITYTSTNSKLVNKSYTINLNFNLPENFNPFIGIGLGRKQKQDILLKCSIEENSNDAIRTSVKNWANWWRGREPQNFGETSILSAIIRTLLFEKDNVISPLVKTLHLGINDKKISKTNQFFQAKKLAKYSLFVDILAGYSQSFLKQKASAQMIVILNRSLKSFIVFPTAPIIENFKNNIKVFKGFSDIDNLASEADLYTKKFLLKYFDVEPFIPKVFRETSLT